MGNADQEKTEGFLQWLKVNKVELRGCKIKYCDRSKGFGIFSDSHFTSEVLVVVPLDLAITPMRVLQDALTGPECRAMFEEGEVDDRFLIILFLMLERLRKNSTWKPYLDMLPRTFGNPLWFTDEELLELKGTALFRATELQKKQLLSLFHDKVKALIKKLLILDGDSESEVLFEDFLWANSVFWTRAMNIPLPHSYVFPAVKGDLCSVDNNSTICNNDIVTADLVDHEDEKGLKDHSDGSQVCGMSSTSLQGETVWVEGIIPGIDFCNHVCGMSSTSLQGETVWVEGIIPGIDFCNHDLKPVATWEVDQTGSTTGVPFSMYLLSGIILESCPLASMNFSLSYLITGELFPIHAFVHVGKVEQTPFQTEKEISISYGNKGNEELLYLYGFVIDDNPDDYLMVHYPVEALQNIPFCESKMQLLEAQKAELRCLLPKSLLGPGFYTADTSKGDGKSKINAGQLCNYSWSGHRKMPSYINKLIFPEELLTTLRTIAMQEDELFKVSSLLEELVGSREERQPTDAEVRAAVWEVCGDSGALQLLVDLLQTKMMGLEESSGSEDCDTKLLDEVLFFGSCSGKDNDSLCTETSSSAEVKTMSRNRWSTMIYRRGQKQLTRLFLQEAEHALHLSLSEEN